MTVESVTLKELKTSYSELFVRIVNHCELMYSTNKICKIYSIYFEKYSSKVW